MKKKLPPNIQSLTDEIENYRKLEKYHEEMAEKIRNDWIATYRERQKQCNHKYEDGTSAWTHNYAYSNCEICRYDDL